MFTAYIYVGYVAFISVLTALCEVTPRVVRIHFLNNHYRNLIVHVL